MAIDKPARTRVLILDGANGISEALLPVLSKRGFHAAAVPGEASATHALLQEKPDVVVLDIGKCRSGREDVLREIRHVHSTLPVIVVGLPGDVACAVRMVKLGAWDYLTTPLDCEQLIRILDASVASSKHRVPAARGPSIGLPEMMGSSPQMQAVLRDIECVAATDFTVVLYGETGSGKELAVHGIHELSRRRDGPLVPVDCGAIPPTLIETELFGHERGAFTGAEARRKGQFEMAAGGTLFLDEIGNLPWAMQSKLLRVLQEHSIQRVGGSELIAVDFRVIAASNQRLEALVASGEFRRDLYYRLNEFCIHIPPLREHPEDIPHYCNRFIRGANRELGKNVLGLDEHATAKALAYDWPGNIRELRNVIRRAALVANGMIEAHQLSIPDRPAQAGTAATEPPLSQGQDTLSLKQRVKPMVAELEGRLIRQALELTHGNKARAARLLGVDYKTLQTKIREHGNEMQHDPTVGK